MLKELDYKKVLLLVLVVAFLLRLVGIDYGLPHFFVGDEQSQVGASLVMLRDFNLIPGTDPSAFNILYYPPVMSYFYLIPILPALLILLFISGFDFSLLAQSVVLDPTLPWMSARVLVVFMGTASVWLVYKLANQIFRDRALSVFSAVLLATSFLHVNLSHFTRHWIPTIFFSLLTYIAVVGLYKNGSKRDYFWSGIFSALSFGVGFIGILNIPIPAIVHFYKKGVSKPAFFSKKLFVNLTVSLFSVALIVSLFPQRFFEIFGGTDISVGQEKTLEGLLYSFWFYIETLFNSDPILLILSAVGLIYLFLKKYRLAFLFSVFISLYIVAIYFVIHNEPRYISFLYPAFVILSAVPLRLLWNRVKSRSLLGYIYEFLIIIVILYPTVISAKLSYLLTKPDTRIEAQNWIEDNVPADTRILSFIHPEVLTPSDSAIDRLSVLDEGVLRTKDYILLETEQADSVTYDLLSVRRVDALNQGRELIRDFDAEYIVLQYWTFEQAVEQRSLVKESDLVAEFASNQSLWSEDNVNNFFVPASLLLKFDQLGPVVRIYRVQN